MAKPAPKKSKSSSAKKAAPVKKASATKKPANAKRQATPTKKPVVKAKSTTQQKKTSATPAKAKSTTAKPAVNLKQTHQKTSATAKNTPSSQKSGFKPAPQTRHEAAKPLAPTKDQKNQTASAMKPQRAGGADSAPRGSVSQPAPKPIFVPEHLKKLQQQLDGIIERPTPTVEHPENKIPTSDIFTDAELAQFLSALQDERSKLLDKARAAVDGGNIALDKDEMYDEVDLASATVDQNLTFRLLDRDRKLLAEIDHAIDKIHNGDFGFCEGTGEPIPKRRLELRPWCKYSVKYKEQLERLKKSGRGVVDEDEDVFA